MVFFEKGHKTNRYAAILDFAFCILHFAFGIDFGLGSKQTHHNAGRLPGHLRTGRVNFGMFKRQKIVATFNKPELERGEGGPLARKVQTRVPGRAEKDVGQQWKILQTKWTLKMTMQPIAVYLF